MGMYDNIMFENGFSTDKPIPDRVLTNSWGQTDQIFRTLDFYMFRDNNGKHCLYRMHPPLYKITDGGNMGSLKNRSIESIEDYSDHWIPINGANGYLRIGMLDHESSYMYEYFVIVENGILQEIVPYIKEVHPLTEEESDGEYLMNEDKVQSILDNMDPVIY